jgi:hypothetical protein
MGYLPLCGSPKPDARWHRARLLIEGRGLRDGCDDWVRRARDFIRRWQELADDPTRQAKLAVCDADVAAAHAVYSSRSSLAKGALEAWLLTGMSSEEVARECGLTAAAVEAYHELFFDVRCRLSATAWVVCNALGAVNLWDAAEGDIDVILKWIGRFGGPFLLRGALDYYRHGLAIPADLTEASVVERNRLRTRLTARAVILALVLPVEKMRRATVLFKLAKELGTLIDGHRCGTDKEVPELPWSALGHRVEAAGTGTQTGNTVARTPPGLRTAEGRRRGGVTLGV